MFRITIDDVFVVRDIVTVSGKCVGKNAFSPKLIDEEGTEYAAAIPFIKHVVPPSSDHITLELRKIENPNTLKGRVLRGVEVLSN